MPTAAVITSRHTTAKWQRILVKKKIAVYDKTCLCTHMRNFKCWTCGQLTYRLKDTTRKLADGSYQPLSAEHVFRDYQFSTGNKIALPD